VSELPQAAFDKINKLDRNHRYNVPARWGFDVFDELSPEQLNKAVNEFVESQKQQAAKA
jgi:L-glyceraldehyde reductase